MFLTCIFFAANLSVDHNDTIQIITNSTTNYMKGELILSFICFPPDSARRKSGTAIE